MNRQLLKCGLVGGIIVFLWMMLSWTLFPWHTRTLNKFENEEKVYQVIRDNAPTSGIYILPNMYVHPAGMSQDEMHSEMAKEHEMMTKGPTLFASVNRDGISKRGVGPFVVSLIIEIIGAGIITWMLLQTKGTSTKSRVGFVTVTGFLIGFLGLLPSWNWWAFSTGFILSCWLDLIVGWFLAGLAIAKMLKRLK